MGYGILLPDDRIAVNPTGAFEAYDERINALEEVRPASRVAREAGLVTLLSMMNAT